MSTSANSIPSGLSLYCFVYPPLTVRSECAADTQFLESDEQARWFAETYGAIQATHGITGRVVFPND
jgi:hypothetical protein